MSMPGFPGGFGDFDPSALGGMLGASGPVSWDIARFIAGQGAAAEPNVDPLRRIRLEELLRVAELHVAEVTGLSLPGGRTPSVEAVTASRWAERTLDDWKPVLERLATALTPQQDPAEAPEVPPGMEALAPLFANLPKLMGPMMMGFQSGMLVAQLSQKAFGPYVLPVPRPGRDALLLVPSAIDAFASDWSLGEDDVSLWLCVHELAHHLVLSQPAVATALTDLLLAYVGAFRPDGVDLESRLGELGTDPESLQRFLGDAEGVLGAMRTEEHERVAPRLDAAVAAIEGYVDHVVDVVAHRLIASHGSLTEALRRRRVEEGPSDRFVGHLLGLDLGDRLFGLGRSWVHGVLERAGEEGLVRLVKEGGLPTPAEITAPGLWLARTEY